MFSPAKIKSLLLITAIVWVRLPLVSVLGAEHAKVSSGIFVSGGVWLRVNPELQMTLEYGDNIGIMITVMFHTNDKGSWAHFDISVATQSSFAVDGNFEYALTKILGFIVRSIPFRSEPPLGYDNESDNIAWI